MYIDRNQALKEVRKSGYILILLSPELQNDREIVLAAVNNEGRAL